MREASNQKPYAFDGSALLCVLFDEPSADYVEARLAGALVTAVIHREVLTMLIGRGVQTTEATAIIGELAVEIVAVGGEEADAGDALNALFRNAGLAPNNRACRALAQMRHAIVVKCDRNWSDQHLNVEIEVVR